MEIEWTAMGLGDLAGLDTGVARRVEQSVERSAATGGGNVKRLQGIDPPEFRLRGGDYRIRILFLCPLPAMPPFNMNTSHAC